MWVNIAQKHGPSGPKRSIRDQQPSDASLTTGSPVPRCCSCWTMGLSQQIALLMLAVWLNKLATTVQQQQHFKLKLCKSPLYWTPCCPTGLTWWLRWSPVQTLVVRFVKQWVFRHSSRKTRKPLKHCLYKMIQFHPHQTWTRSDELNRDID